MSFNNPKKPKLVESKLSQYYINKIKDKEAKIKMENDLLEKQKIELELLNQPKEPFYKKILDKVIEFIKKNYGFIIMSSLLIILLYIRYIEVNKRKIQMKEIMDKINEKQYQEDKNDESEDYL